MKKRYDLPTNQLYESIYAPVQTYKKDKQNDSLKLDYIKQEQKRLRKELHGYPGRLFSFAQKSWKYAFGHYGEEYIFLAFLAILVAHISYMMDKGAWMLNNSRVWLYRDLAEHPWAKYFAWICLPVCLCMWGAGFVKLVFPEAAGSGIPHIKTILRGVELDGYLTFRALIAKVVGITSTMGSLMPLGKEGPLIHISSCCATLLGKLVSFQGIYQNESRKVEMLAAACAIGVACTFAAPIGGVLLSIEITTAYFAVRNLWRGFYAAVWAATVYRLLYVWIESFESISVVFKTSFYVDHPFAAQELFAFSILGIICGLGAAFYMRMKIKFGKFIAKSMIINSIKKANFFVYPGVAAAIVASISFPLGIGRYMACQLPYPAQVIQLFSNFTWNSPNLTRAQQDVVKNWETEQTGFYLHLVCFIAFNFVCSIISSSIPMPSGCFIPNFRMGAAIGRIMGELMNTWYPIGLSYYGRLTKIIPGGYAVVGAAAFSGAVTQTMAPAVIILEMTSQITHVIPILIAVLISNGIARFLGPSIYNSVIISKKLPYLPDLLPNNSAYYSVYVEDFMTTDVKYLYHGMPFERLKNLLTSNRKLRSFPLVNNPIRMILLGSIQRGELLNLFDKHLGKERRLKELTAAEESSLRSKKFENEEDAKFIENPLYSKPKKKSKAVTLPRRRICDLPPNLQRYWEEDQLKESVDFSACFIDPAPFQIVEKTSLLKVHTVFLLLGVNTAHVTSVGRLIGLVTLHDLRKAIDDVNSGNLQAHNIQIIVTTDSVEKIVA